MSIYNRELLRSMEATTQVVVIGGSHAGLGVAKMILNSVPKARVTIINTSRDYYFNIAAPRVLARPEAVSIDQVLIPIPDLFKKHAESQFQFVHATAIDFDPVKKTVTTDDGGERRYDFLVIASGSHTLSVISEPYIPVKPTVEDTLRESIPAAQKTIADAKRIVIGGGGPVGIEVASEIAEAYPDKTITMVFASYRFLDTLKEAASIEAGKKLNKLGITVRSGTKVKLANMNKDTKEWTIDLMDGTTMQADLYISAVGVLPNNKFIPPSLLSPKGWLITDDYLAVPGISGVYGVGDIVEGQPKMATVIKAQTTVVAKNLIADINGTGTRKVLKPPAMGGMIVPIGGLGGTGQIGSWVPWSWMISWFKGDYFLSKTDMFVSQK